MFIPILPFGSEGLCSMKPHRLHWSKHSLLYILKGLILKMLDAPFVGYKKDDEVSSENEKI